jgi:signal transduction histidine kinase
MERQTFRAARIVGSLLEFARNRRGELAPVSLARVLSEAGEEAAERCRERGVRLAWTPPGEDVLVLGSETELAQVFVNLVGNALDAMRHGGTLTLSLEADERRAFASVEDTGVGIGPGELGKIFQPFFSTKLSEGGTGLGLSISYEIVRRHRGEMRVASNPGQGSRFIVELPRHLPPSEEVTVEHPHRG